MVFPLKLPQKSNQLTFQIWDKDFDSPDDYVTEMSLNFDDLADKAFNNERIVKVLKYNIFNKKFTI